jgi:pyruvate/2-oxoglutarate dehydrogenase complex dihydrolipoamide acyltransferase (E2) component
LEGEVFYRKIEDLSPYGQLRNYQRGSGFEGTNEGKDLFRTLKLYALQEYLEDEETPSEDVMEKYKVTVYYRDADGDRIVISTPKELCSVITEACREYKSSPLPSPRNNVVKLMAKVVAKVEPASSPPTPLPPLVPAASTPTRPTATTSTQTAQDKDSAAAPTAATEPEAPEPPPANAPEGPSPSPAPTAPRSSPTPPPPTLQDVVDAVVAVVGPAVRVSVRAVEHAASQVAAAEARAHRAAAAAKAKKAPPSPEEASAPPVPPRPFIHGHHTCDGCGMRPIVGERYHCVDPDVPDYDLCAACHASCAGSAARRFEVARLGTCLLLSFQTSP